MVPKNESELDAVLTQLSEGQQIATLFSRFEISPMALVSVCVWRGSGSQGVSLNLGPLPNFIIWIYSQYFHLRHSRFYHPRFQFHKVFHYNATCSFTQYGAWVGCVPFHMNSQRNNQNIPENCLYDMNNQACFLIFF